MAVEHDQAVVKDRVHRQRQSRWLGVGALPSRWHLVVGVVQPVMIALPVCCVGLLRAVKLVILAAGLFVELVAH